MDSELENKIKFAFVEINEGMEAHLIESIISLFHRGVLRHYVRSPRQKIDESNFTMSIEAASGVTFEGRQKIIDLEAKLAKALELIKLCSKPILNSDKMIACDEFIKTLEELGEDLD